MGCGNCGTGADGKPSGCKSNGGCSTGGCNRMNVFDWLSTLPLHDGARPYPVIEVSFNKGSRKDFYYNSTGYIPEKNEWIAVEGTSGFDIGQISLTGELVKLQLKKYSVPEHTVTKKLLRQATDEDLQQYEKQKEREAEILIRSRAIARSLNLEMKLCEVEVQADGKKATFFYTADQRVDFRELIKLFASDFKLKVEMRQIGARQESGKVGGIGSCGRELCCSTWLTDFKSVNTTAARYQNLSINQTKLSGQCGRLKCCLNYELDTYMDALRVFPDNAEVIQTIKGNATLQKKDIFKNLMWYTYSDSSKQYPVTITQVKEILLKNKEGVRPDDLQPVELETKESRAGIKVDVGFVNDVGQITLKALEKNSNKKKGNNSGSGQRQNAEKQGNNSGSRQRQGVEGQGNKGNGQRQQADGQGNKGSGQRQGAERQGNNRGSGQRQGAEGQGNKDGGQQQGAEGQQPNSNQQPDRQQQQPNRSKPQQNRPPQAKQPGQEVEDNQPQQQRPNRNNNSRNRNRDREQKPPQEDNKTE